MAIRDLINKFTSGELDPKMLAEVDYEGYRKGARKLRNVLTLPQGAVQRRFGTNFIQKIVRNTSGTTITDESTVNILSYEVDDDIYIFVIKPNDDGSVAVDVYKNKVLFQNILVLGNYTLNDISEIRWVNNYNAVYLFHKDYMPRILQITALVTDVEAIFSSYPTEDFSYIDFPANNYTNNGCTFTPNLVAATTLTATIASFTSNHAGIGGLAGGIFYGNGGAFRIYSVNAAGTVATGITITDFIDTTAILGSESALLERKWGDGAVVGVAPTGVARGYPTHGTFFQGRLVLGGSPFSPGSASASVVKSYFDFDDTDPSAANGWSVEAGSSGTDKVTDILSSKSLIILTTKGSNATNILIDSPTTPTNVFLNEQGTEGSRVVDGQILDNHIFYIDTAGNTVWSMTYDVPDSGYTIANASILSSHLIRNPLWSAVYDPVAIDGRYLLIVNEDGTIAGFNSIAAENIKAWTLSKTIGKFVDITTIANEAYVLTKRLVGSGTDASGVPQEVYWVDYSFNAFVNQRFGTAFVTVGDFILIGNEQPFNKLQFLLTVLASSDVGITIEYLANTGGWNSITGFTDTTAGFTANGYLEWNVATDTLNWESQTIDQTDEQYNELNPYYWIRIKRTSVVLVTPPEIGLIEVNLKTTLNLEEVSFGTYMDSTVRILGRQALATGVITGLTNLAGMYVFAFASDFPIGRFYVDSTGSVDLGAAAFYRDVTIGLDYKVNITPMPIVGMFQNGYSVYDDMHVDKVYVDYFRTLGLTVQAQVTPEVVPGVYLTDETPYPQTGYSKIPSFNGWDPRVEFVISQSYPAPMTLLAVSYTVEVNP